MSKQRYVIVRGQVFRWEEKAPFVPSGVSVIGAMEYSPESEKVKCHECGEWFTRLGMHVSRRHSGIREYKREHGLRVSTALCGPSERSRSAKWSQRAYALGKRHDVREIPIPRERALSYLKLGRTGAPVDHERRNEKAKCDAQFIARVKQIAEDLDRSPRFRDLSVSDQHIAEKRFGGLYKVLEIAGLDISKYRYKWKEMEDSVLVELLRDFYVLNKRLPRHCDWSNGSLPNSNVYIKRFGSIRNAYNAAGLSSIRIPFHPDPKEGTAA